MSNIDKFVVTYAIHYYHMSISPFPIVLLLPCCPVIKHLTMLQWSMPSTKRIWAYKIMKYRTMEMTLIRRLWFVYIYSFCGHIVTICLAMCVYLKHFRELSFYWQPSLPKHFKVTEMAPNTYFRPNEDPPKYMFNQSPIFSRSGI